MSIVEVKNLCVKFGKFFAVNDVSFSVNEGEIFGFLGANGAGKTTTIRVICGLIIPTSGSVIVDGEHFLKGKEDIIKRKVGYMSQKFTLYEDLTIYENLEFSAKIRSIPYTEFKKRKDELFSMIQFNKNENTLVSELASGIKQQMALVASLIHNPKLVVLDEPTAGVSPAARTKFWDLINELTRKGKTVFVTTHYMDEAENCGRVALMRSGELIALGAPQELKEKTFNKQMYRLKCNKNFDNNLLERIKSNCESFEPYGNNYHVIWSDNFDFTLLESEDFKSNFSITEIQPSLEDVFIRQVEGDR